MRWESFATGTRYLCPIPECNPRSQYQNRNLLMDHLQIAHGIPPPDTAHYQEVQTLIDRGRPNVEREAFSRPTQ